MTVLIETLQAFATFAIAAFITTLFLPLLPLAAPALLEWFCAKPAPNLETA